MVEALIFCVFVLGIKSFPTGKIMFSVGVEGEKS
jgi:hypothetical protein